MWPFKHKNEEYYYNVGIKFKEQLSNGALIFLIVDDDYDWIGGYVVVSPSGIARLVKNDIEDLGDLDDKDDNYLKKTAEAFYKATV